MKIGIYTLPLHTNYGGILQAFALQKVLKELEHEVWLLDRERNFKLSFKSLLKTYLKRLYRKYILNDKGTIFFTTKQRKKEFEIISINTKKFIEKYIHPSTSINNVNQIPKDFFDVIIVGSDQIWRPRYNYPKIEDAFLNFTKSWSDSTRRISYAASFGTSNWEYTKSQTEKCKKLVQKFDAVSVREESAIQLCNNYFDVDARLVLDPTMLLDVSDYIEIAGNCKKDFPGELFVYILDNNEATRDIVNKVSEFSGYNPFYSSTDNQNANLEKRIATPVEEWLKSFLASEFVVTDSFHACVFSILFNKPFIAMGNHERGLSRFQSLLGLFQLENRLLLVNQKYSLDSLCCDIDWCKINMLLERYRNLSFRFLSDSLEM